MSERQKEIEKLRDKLARMYEKYEINNEAIKIGSLDGGQSDYNNIARFYSEEIRRINKQYPKE